MSLTADYSTGRKLYRHAEKRLPSVSMIVSELTGERFEGVPLDSLLKACLEGTGAHRLACNIALLRAGHLSAVDVLPLPDDYPAPAEEWFQAMGRAEKDIHECFNRHQIEPIAVEQRSICTAYNFAGQPDMMAELTWKGKRVRAVIDYKRVQALSIGNYLQVCAYRMLDAYISCRKGFILWLKKEGGWKLVPVEYNPHNTAALLGTAVVLNWRIANGLLNIRDGW